MKSIHSHMRVLRHVHTNTHTYNPTCLLMGCWGDSCANEAIFRWDHCRMPWLLFPFQNSIKDVCLIPFIKLTHTCATSAEGEQKQWKLICDKQAVVYTSSKQWTPLISYCIFLVSYNWWGKIFFLHATRCSPTVTVFYLSPVWLKIHCLLNDTVRITRINQNKSDISRKARWS